MPLIFEWNAAGRVSSRIKPEIFISDGDIVSCGIVVA